MLDLIKNELREGEKLLWTGAPEEFETLDLTTKTPFIRKAIIILTVVLAICIWYVTYCMNNGVKLKPALVVVLVICALIGSFNFYFQAKKLRRTTYAITDQRLISIIDLPKSVEFSAIKEIQLKSDADGHVSVLCGSQTINAKAHQWRSLALTDPYIDQETGLCDRFILYAIPDAENVKKILGDFLPL